MVLQREPGDGKVLVTLVDEKCAREIVTHIAERHELYLWPGPYYTGPNAPYRILVLFHGRAFLKPDVALGASVDKDASEIMFTIMDQGNGPATEFTSTIERELDEEVARRFPGFTRTWDRASVPRNPLAP